MYIYNIFNTVEIKRKQRGQNSFVAPHNSHTFQLDLVFISKDDIEATQKFRAGLVMIDVLSKYVVVVLVSHQQVHEGRFGHRNCGN
jgi:hypothetical protein